MNTRTGTNASCANRRLCILTPVFEDGHAFAQLCLVLAGLKLGRPVELIVVDDGSIADPPDIASLTSAALTGTIIRLKRNMGHQAAIAVGLSYLDGRHMDSDVVIMDSDGEDDPADLPHLLSAIGHDNISVAVATRRNRTEGVRFRIGYLIYRALFQVLTGRPLRFGNFMALSPFAVGRLSAMNETWLHVAAAVAASRLKVAYVALDRGKRFLGQTQMSFLSLVLHGMRAMMVFAETVLTRVAFASAAVIALSVVVGVIAATMKLTSQASPGWFTTVIGTLVLVILQTSILTAVVLILTGIARAGPPPDVSGAYQRYIRAIETN